MKHADLRSIHAEGVSFRGVILDMASLQEAFLFAADLSKASFRQANLSNLFFRNGMAQQASFVYANLDNADLRNANMTGSSFVDASLIKTNFTDSLLDHTSFLGANLSQANIKTLHNKGMLVAISQISSAYWSAGFFKKAICLPLTLISVPGTSIAVLDGPALHCYKQEKGPKAGKGHSCYTSSVSGPIVAVPLTWQGSGNTISEVKCRSMIKEALSKK